MTATILLTGQAGNSCERISFHLHSPPRDMVQCADGVGVLSFGLALRGVMVDLCCMVWCGIVWWMEEFLAAVDIRP